MIKIPNRTNIRLVLMISILLLSTVFGVINFNEINQDPFGEFESQYEDDRSDREALAPERNGITVFTAHLRKNGDIVALDSKGKVLYHNDTHDGYWDVDPSPEGTETVVYAATDEIYNSSLCEPVEGDYCVRQMIERANLSTGEVTLLYSRIDPQYHASEWHDIDRVSESDYIVADMYSDSVFRVNTNKKIILWEWQAQDDINLDTGGSYPTDWTHLNDVEQINNSLIMVSLRNQDQIVFVDPQSGVRDDLTLGTEDDYDMMYEQHNPDYVPASKGGPAVIIADSENNRIIEYQRRSGKWHKSWRWKDSQLQWPRDADRLPNNNTLISDTHGGRIIEVSPEGESVWEVDVPSVYEAERLGTGDESNGGYSATTSELKSASSVKKPVSDGPVAAVQATMIDILPSKLLNGISAVKPGWMGFFDVAIAFVIFGLISLWGFIEIYWSNFHVRPPIYRE